MIDYDFIEIGTSDFETLAQQYPDARGISVEPIKKYLDRLPNRDNLIKCNAALVTEAQYVKDSTLDVFYVSEEIIDKNNLGLWMKGCNSVGKPHDFHVGYFHDPGVWHDAEDRTKLASRNLLEEGLVTKESVPVITWRLLVHQYNIGRIKVLKTDTEGMDAILIRDILQFYWDNHRMGDLPELIHFEDNAHTDKAEMKTTKEMMSMFGYDVDDSKLRGHDSYARLRTR